LGGYLATGDLNNDGNLDLVEMNRFGQSTVSIFPGNGDGTFQAPVSLPLGSGLQYPVLADFNGDGNLDLAFRGSN